MMFRKMAILVCLMVTLSGCKQTLYSGLSEEDVNEMLSILMRHAIDTTKQKQKDGLYDLVVEESQLPVAIDILKQYGLPKEKVKNMGDVFRKDGLVSSPFEERVRYIYALSQNVQETLMQIDGVLTARVHIVLPENDPYQEKVKPASASVFIKYHPKFKLANIKQDVKFIVEKSIEGLSYDKISVVMLPAESLLEDDRVPAPVAETGWGSALLWLFAGALGAAGILSALNYRTRQLRHGGGAHGASVNTGSTQGEAVPEPEGTNREVGENKSDSVAATAPVLKLRRR